MPTTREEHIKYTRNELNNHQYYIDVINVLINEGVRTYVDIGANTGEFYKVMNEKLPTITESYLIEPELENFNFMCDNVKNDNVTFINCGIGYSLNNPVLVNNNNVGGYKVIESSGGINDGLIIKTLEELKLPLVDLVKMDIEGAEFNVIENSTWLSKIKWLEIEFHQTPQQSVNGFIPKYITKYLPNYTIIVHDRDSLNLYGRCLLKLKDI